MWKRAGAALLIVAVGSCGAGGKDEPMNDTAISQLSLSSGDLAEGQPLPAAHTCDGADRAPSLNWAEPPKGTGSFALVVDDPDAPGGLFHHWGVYDIPADARSISAGQTLGKQALNDFGKPGYGGPCPPKGHGLHHYHFKLFALDVDHLDLGASPKVAEVENAATKRAIAKGELIGTYERK